jgi:hypothetical protein
VQLAELQQTFARAVLAGTPLPASLFAPARAPWQDGLNVHRNTVLGGIAKALALTFPTVLWLVGQDAFDRLAAEFAAAHPPSRARLDEYGEGFPEFLESSPLTTHHACLGDVARLDLAIDRAAAAPRLSRILPIDAVVALSAPVSLTVADLAHPADLIRDAMEAADRSALAAIEPGPRRLAVWRAGAGASAAPLSRPAARFLDELLHGRPAGEAMAYAAAGEDPQSALLAIQAEVFAAPFATVTPIPQEEDPS